MVRYFTYCTILYSYVPCSFPAHTSPCHVSLFLVIVKEDSMSVHNKRSAIRRNFQKVTETIAGKNVTGFFVAPSTKRTTVWRRVPARLNPNEPSAPTNESLML